MIMCEARIGFQKDQPPCRNGAVVYMTVTGAEDLNCVRRPTCTTCALVTLGRVGRWFGQSAKVETFDL